MIYPICLLTLVKTYGYSSISSCNLTQYTILFFMKKITLIAGLLAMSWSMLQAQIARKPLVEHFTQASCGPCAGQNPTLYNTLNTFGDSNYVKVTYQTSWPGIDPMNAAYPAGPDARRRLYGVTGVPSANLNGSTPSSPNTAVTAATLQTAAGLMSNFELRSSHRYLTGRDIEVTIVIKNVGTTNEPAGRILHTAMTEKSVTYASAPGSNGETAFFNVVRNMYNASNGVSSTAGFSMPAMNTGDSATYTFTITSPTYIRTYDEIGFATFIQDSSTNEVLQSEYSAPLPISVTYDVSTANATFAGTVAGYCDPNLTPSFDVTNTKATTITSVDAQYTINGGTPVPINVTGLNLTQGQSTTITFPAITLTTGAKNIEYTVLALNGSQPDFSSSNNIGLKGLRVVASNTAVANTISTDFQTIPVGVGAPSNTISVNPNRIAAFKVDNTISSTITQNLGGFGNSNGCYMWDFWNIQSGTASIVYEKIDLAANANINGAKIKWASAHGHYNNSPDRLRVKVSTDCGATWTTLYNKAGSALANAGNVTNGRFFPQPNQWVWDSVNLDNYITETELMIAFEGESGFGNSLYIDDINMEYSYPVNVNQVDAPAAQLALFPNPVSNVLNVSFETAATSELTLTISNALGQTIQHVASGTYQGPQTIQVNTSELAAGVYFINAVGKNGVTTKQFIVER